MSSSALEQGHLDATRFRRTPFYCEENVYWLCKKLCDDGIAEPGGSDLFVVFISNDQKQIPLWHQKASHRTDGVVLLDYHVICVQKKKVGEPPSVWDLDSTLNFPSPLNLYISETIRPSFQLFTEFERFFRIVHAPLFLRGFASDRRHMKDSNGSWMEEPPTYEPIVAEDGTVHNLNEFVRIQAADVVGDTSIDSMKDAVFAEKLGAVINQRQLADFLAYLS